MKTILEEAGLSIFPYDAQWGNYRVRLDATITDKQREVLLKLIREARDGFGK